MHKQFLRMALALLIPVMVMVGCWTPPAWALTAEQQLISEAWRIVNRAYLDETFNHQNWWVVREQAVKAPLENREATYGSIQKMLATLDDPFTRLLKPEQYHSLQVSTSGELTGVGLQIALDPETGELTVVAPLAGSPADQAAIQPRDRILKIDGLSTAEMTLDEAAARMRGPSGTPVVLTLVRASNNTTEEVKLTRALITLNPVEAALRTLPGEPPLGYIRLSQFSANATAEMATAIEQLEKQGATAYILDLRSNPGGLLQAAIEIARLWLDQGTIVYTADRHGIVDSFDAVGTTLTHDPLVVLVNQGTASASEILAGALHDNGRATLVGEKTFGKGLIQSLFDLSDGSGLAVTVAKYETPNHTDIHKQGIKPDQVVPLDPITRDQVATAADRQYQAAVELLRRKKE